MKWRFTKQSDEQRNTTACDTQYYQQHFGTPTQHSGYGADGSNVGGTHRRGGAWLHDLQFYLLEFRISEDGYYGYHCTGFRQRERPGAGTNPGQGIARGFCAGCARVIDAPAAGATELFFAQYFTEPVGSGRGIF